MSILFVMIPLALVLLGFAVAAFFWAVRSGQFDDLEMHGTMVLFDEEPVGSGRRDSGDGRDERDARDDRDGRDARDARGARGARGELAERAEQASAGSRAAAPVVSAGGLR